MRTDHVVLLDFRNEEEHNRSGEDRESRSNPERSARLRRTSGESSDDDGEQPSTDECTELSSRSTANVDSVSTVCCDTKIEQSTHARP